MTTPCTVEDCSRPLRARGLCLPHYKRARAGSDLAPALRPLAAVGCSVDGCAGSVRSTAAVPLCGRHRNRRASGYLGPERITATQCAFDGCAKPPRTRSYCVGHYGQLRLGRDLTPLYEPPRRRYNHDGYVEVYRPGERGVPRSGRIMEHRWVMQELLDRLLLPGETVHHRNGQRDDNRPENLELWVSSQPSGQRVEDVVAHARTMLARYDPAALA